MEQNRKRKGLLDWNRTFEVSYSRVRPSRDGKAHIRQFAFDVGTAPMGSGITLAAQRLSFGGK